MYDKVAWKKCNEIHEYNKVNGGDRICVLLALLLCILRGQNFKGFFIWHR